jgi:hypothetical protein
VGSDPVNVAVSDVEILGSHVPGARSVSDSDEMVQNHLTGIVGLYGGVYEGMMGEDLSELLAYS